ncbi:MAG: zinc-binding dehydrogenase [Defluviitaleaceae bacterium]|nr:zinc-binding dehydrogenase [Defluviitaleaceae bacterium]MCL2837093.1 zinc-binding dehydrogenase [Defluviitaleaceae bacterium]
MKTLIVDKNGALSIGEVSKPSINEYQALVKMIACGVCNGTDTKLIHGNFKGFSYEKDYPMMLGHEGVGRVAEVGAKVSGYKVGDVVLLPFAGPLDGVHCGWGAYSEYGVVNDAKALADAGIAVGAASFPDCAFGQNIVPPDIDPVDSVMIITLREVLSSIKTFGISANQSVVIFGCGPVGMTFIRFLSLLGVHPIIAFDIDGSKLEAAVANGAAYAYNSNNLDVAGSVREICPGGVDCVIDAVGVLGLINQGLRLIKDRGKICCYGISPDCRMELDWADAPYNWNICFQQFPSKIEEGETHAQILAWLRSGAINLKDYISDYVEFKDIISAFERLERREIKLKCVIKY